MRKEAIRRKTDTIDKLEDALMRLLEEKDISEIKTRELCLSAGVNHQTFYNYYYDHFDLYEEIEKKAIEEAMGIIRCGFQGTSREDQSEYIGKIKETRYFMRLFRQKQSSSFKGRMLNAVYPFLNNEIRIMSRERDRKFITIYILNGSLSILEEWIKDGCQEDSDHIATIIYKIAGSIDPYH